MKLVASVDQRMTLAESLSETLYRRGEVRRSVSKIRRNAFALLRLAITQFVYGNLRGLTQYNKFVLIMRAEETEEGAAARAESALVAAAERVRSQPKRERCRPSDCRGGRERGVRRGRGGRAKAEPA